MKDLKDVLKGIPNYPTDFGVERMTVEGILIPFYNQFGFKRVVCKDKDSQDRDIDCIIDGKKIQEKSSTIYDESNPKILAEVYNNILAECEKDGKFGWGLITEAYRHIYGYRGTSDKKSINYAGTYVCIYESSEIKKICWEAVNTPEFESIVNEYKKSLNGRALTDKSVFLGECKLKGSGITVEVWSNCSKNSKQTNIKHAITISIPVEKFKGAKKVYKYKNNKFIEQ